jgi:uncharacterized phage-associated protein
MPLPGYNVRKAAQTTAFFAIKEGGSINVLKVAKLLYLADRECLSAYDFPILFDYFVSMAHGPVTSTTLDYINGQQEDPENWDVFISGREGHFISIARPDIKIDDLDELSDAELEVLEKVWGQFGHMTKYQVRDYTHDSCLEWEDPHGSSTPIPYERVLRFLGKKHVAEIVEEIDTVRALDKTFGSHSDICSTKAGNPADSLTFKQRA